MSPFQIVSALRTRLQSGIETCLINARESRAGASEKWNAYLMAMSVEPLGEADRSKRYQLNEEAQQGALPVEVRAALDQLVRQMLTEMDVYKEKYGHEPWWERRVEKPIRQLASDLHKQSLDDYISLMRNQNATSRILENAAQVSYGFKEYFQKQEAKSYLCPTCRAARPADGDLNVCYFCGTSLFQSAL